MSERLAQGAIFTVAGIILIGIIWLIALSQEGSHFIPPPQPPTDKENWREVRRQIKDMYSE